MLRIGVRLPATFGRAGEFLADVTSLEAGGADTIWLDGAAWKPAGSDPIEPQLEPWVLLAAMAAVTHRVRLGAAIAVADWPPVLFAATVIALERVCAGRSVLSLRLDDSRRQDEFVAIAKKLWSGSVDPHQGEFYSVPAVHLAAGVRTGGPPILVLGDTNSDHEWAARVGDGIIQPGAPPERVASSLARVRDLRAAASRDGDFELWADIPLPPNRAEWVKIMAGYESAGVTGVIVPWDPRVVDLVRNAGVEDDRSDLLISTG